jgi:tetratricopeptide (TPR) repeat protein
MPITMLRGFFSVGLTVTFLFGPGCSAFQVGSSIQRGRTALKLGKPELALAHFQRAAQLDPNYVLDFTQLPQGVWTYVGRAFYAQGQFARAGEAFEKARSIHPKDQLARLYMGLVLARRGDRPQGLREIELGLTELERWLDDLDMNHPDGQFWDPGRDLRNQMQTDLALISSKAVKWPELIASVERLGIKFEEEIDRARRDKKEELYIRDGDGSPGN